MGGGLYRLPFFSPSWSCAFLTRRNLGIFTYLSFSTPHLCLHQIRIEFDENPTLQELRDYCFQDQLSKQDTLLANLLSRAQRFMRALS
jgi:hypothetical protein